MVLGSSLLTRFKSYNGTAPGGKPVDTTFDDQLVKLPQEVASRAPPEPPPAKAAAADTPLAGRPAGAPPANDTRLAANGHVGTRAGQARGGGTGAGSARPPTGAATATPAERRRLPQAGPLGVSRGRGSQAPVRPAPPARRGGRAGGRGAGRTAGGAAARARSPTVSEKGSVEPIDWERGSTVAISADSRSNSGGALTEDVVTSVSSRREAPISEPPLTPVARSSTAAARAAAMEAASHSPVTSTPPPAPTAAAEVVQPQTHLSAVQAPPAQSSASAPEIGPATPQQADGPPSLFATTAASPQPAAQPASDKAAAAAVAPQAAPASPEALLKAAPKAAVKQPPPQARGRPQKKASGLFSCCAGAPATSDDDDRLVKSSSAARRAEVADDSANNAASTPSLRLSSDAPASRSILNGAANGNASARSRKSGDGHAAAAAVADKPRPSPNKRRASPEKGRALPDKGDKSVGSKSVASASSSSPERGRKSSPERRPRPPPPLRSAPAAPPSSLGVRRTAPSAAGSQAGSVSGRSISSRSASGSRQPRDKQVCYGKRLHVCTLYSLRIFHTLCTCRTLFAALGQRMLPEQCCSWSLPHHLCGYYTASEQPFPLRVWSCSRRRSRGGTGAAAAAPRATPV